MKRFWSTYTHVGTKHDGIEDLIKKGKKALFLLQKMLNKSKVKIMGNKLRECLVKP